MVQTNFRLVRLCVTFSKNFHDGKDIYQLILISFSFKIVPKFKKIYSFK